MKPKWNQNQSENNENKTSVCVFLIHYKRIGLELGCALQVRPFKVDSVQVGE